MCPQPPLQGRIGERVHAEHFAILDWIEGFPRSDDIFWVILDLSLDELSSGTKKMRSSVNVDQSSSLKLNFSKPNTSIAYVVVIDTSPWFPYFTTSAWNHKCCFNLWQSSSIVYRYRYCIQIQILYTDTDTEIRYCVHVRYCCAYEQCCCTHVHWQVLPIIDRFCNYCVINNLFICYLISFLF